MKLTLAGVCKLDGLRSNDRSDHFKENRWSMKQVVDGFQEGPLSNGNDVSLPVPEPDQWSSVGMYPVQKVFKSTGILDVREVANFGVSGLQRWHCRWVLGCLTK